MRYNIIIKPEAEKILDGIIDYSLEKFDCNITKRTKSIIDRNIGKIRRNPYNKYSKLYDVNEYGLEIRKYDITDCNRSFGVFYYVNEEQNPPTIYILRFFGLNQDIPGIYNQISKIKESKSFIYKFLADIDKMNQQIIENFRNSF